MVIVGNTKREKGSHPLYLRGGRVPIQLLLTSDIKHSAFKKTATSLIFMVPRMGMGAILLSRKVR